MGVGGAHTASFGVSGIIVDAGSGPYYRPEDDLTL